LRVGEYFFRKNLDQLLEEEGLEEGEEGGYLSAQAGFQSQTPFPIFLYSAF
jgi:hypothetical protein